MNCVLPHARNKQIFYGKYKNSSMLAVFNGASSNISMDEIYSIDYNNSILQFRSNSSYQNNPFVVEVTVISIFGLDGSSGTGKPYYLTGPLMFQLASPAEVCQSFYFAWAKGTKTYKLKIRIFAEQQKAPSFKGFMSLPNQARSFDRFQLFKNISLPTNKNMNIDYLIYSLKLLERRSTTRETCIDVENYDKVNKYWYFRVLYLKYSFISNCLMASTENSSKEAENFLELFFK